ncbi:MAG TPA: RNA-guided pseudouridylation complex pseudouridine synthase subunit Cbf5 [Methanomicrobia archaeon]|nr:RNA-guided pseudouridylation complex pseudouridine synthase subunit Cbf5 [Methanomicrobia archaeon]
MHAETDPAGTTAPRIIERIVSTTNPRYGCAPEHRSIEDMFRRSIIIVDKTRGPTSHEVVAWVKDILSVGRAGHSGTLDPKVTGVLPVALEDATKIVKQLLDIGKEYVCLMRLHSDVDDEALSRVLKEFTGVILQRPPVKSAVKRQVRPREIDELEMLERKGSYVLVRVSCQAGTYVRKLVYDIGLALGCGANMAELRRTRVGEFTEDHLVTLQDIADAQHAYLASDDEAPLRRMLIPMERAVDHLPTIWIKDSAVDAICHGADVAIPGIVRLEDSVRKGQRVAVMSLKGELVALGTARMSARAIGGGTEGIAVTTTRVLMDPGTYPSHWKGSV